MARTRVPNAGRRTNRVDGIRALDRYTNPRGGRMPARPGGAIPRRPGAGGVSAAPPRQPGVPQPARPGGGVSAPGQMVPQAGQHPFIPGANLAPVVPANVSESGSPPGTPNLGNMVMRSFQPQVLERTPLISNGAGVPAQSPNQAFNFGGPQLPPGQQGMVPQEQRPMRQAWQPQQGA